MRTRVCGVLLSLWLAAHVLAESVSTFPAVFFSEQLVPGLRSKFHENDNVYTKKELVDQVHYAVDGCVSDAYFLINQPGLRLDDFHNFTNHGYLRAYMGRASSIQAMPSVLVGDGSALDMNALNEHIEMHCQAKTHRVVTDQSEEVPHYIDIKKRVIRINFSGLPEDPEARDAKLKDHDDVIHEIVRRLPSPHYFMLYTTNDLKPFEMSSSKKVNVYEEYPDNLVSLDQLTSSQKARLLENSIFPDLTLFDKTREHEFERNGNVRQAKSRAEFPKPRLTNDKFDGRDFGRFWNDINDLPSLVDQDLVKENALVILAIIALVSVFVTYKFVAIVVFGLKIMVTGKPKRE